MEINDLCMDVFSSNPRNKVKKTKGDDTTFNSRVELFVHEFSILKSTSEAWNERDVALLNKNG